MELTVKQWVKNLSDAFLEAKIDTPDLDAKLLVCHALDLSDTDYFLEPNKLVSDAEQKSVETYKERRLKREPVSQIMGNREFWSLTFKVTKDTLTPRPDSETLIEAIIEEFKGREHENLDFLDLGAGTGCLLLSALSEFKNADGLAVDYSEATLNVAKENTENLGFSERVSFIRSHWCDDLPKDQKFDVIISNPPYIAENERPDLSPEVEKYEPDSALFAGQDGLDDYRILAEQIPDHLKSGGVVFLEIGYTQASEVSEIFLQNQASSVQVKQDLGARDRCLIIKY